MADAIIDSLTAANLFNLTGVVAVVTGGGTGIGLMISSALVANGATVYIIGPSQADLDKVSKTYSDAAASKPGRGKMYGLEGDIRQKTEAKRLADEIGRREKYITILFNNAGVLSGRFTRPTSGNPSAADYVQTLFDGVSQEDFAHNLNTNAVGPYWLSVAFLPLLEKWKLSGEPVAKRFAPQIVMTSSMNGWTKDAATAGFSFPYMFSKSAIGHFTSSLARELLPLGVRVNGIAPGFFITEMTAPGTKDDSGSSRLPDGQKTPFEIPVKPEAGAGTARDMGALALFLTANMYMSGETVLIDGGTLLKHPSSY
ncbi:hypothetical protein HGRIS_011581 [Hohenbuehelia grisea]|uniref:NAD(P)-binding protein n=1 Tax=Hohenbuehelia grisea TaxID=104357 RepID=A0ABR3JWL8_9AGAR